MPLADDAALQEPLAVALGANQASAAGRPRETLAAVRPHLEEQLIAWADQPLQFHWSTLLTTDPVGPVDQPCYLNGVVLVNNIARQPSEAWALQLLERLHALERQFGRDREREQRWGPRTLDLDLLFWGELRLETARLVLPHPRLHLRTFVLEPLLQVMRLHHNISR